MVGKQTLVEEKALSAFHKYWTLVRSYSPLLK
jgi:hypothetical protein